MIYQNKQKKLNESINRISSSEISRSYTPLLKAVSKRKAAMMKKVRSYDIPILDVYHGEMTYSMSPKACDAIERQTKLLLQGKARLLEADDTLFSKSQPRILRQLAAQKLYPQFRYAGLALPENEVIVCPYSSLIMLETALMTIAQPGGCILCPSGFYKSNILHIEKFDLELKFFDVDLEKDGRITATALAHALKKHQKSVCGLLLTMPGNPLEADYSDAELQAIGEVIAANKVKVIVDATFTGIHNYHKPLAAVKIGKGDSAYLLHNQVLTITGLSKGHQACGPYKIGVATSGNTAWLAKIKNKLVLSFQRETTLFAKTLIENTSFAYVRKNEMAMQESQKQVKVYFNEINEFFDEKVIKYYGSAKYGPFVLITFNNAILKKAGIMDSWQLADMLLLTVGINCVSGIRMGIAHPSVRVNINAPRMKDKKDAALLKELFSRLKRFLSHLIYEDLTYEKVLAQYDVRRTTINSFDYPR